MTSRLLIACLLPAAAWAASLPDTTVPLSCAIQVKAHNSTAQDFDQIHELGIAWIRRGFIWEGIEKEKGVYDFTVLDQVIGDARARGLSVLGCIAFGNKLYPAVTTAEGRAAYAAFAAACATRYQGKVAMWEIWNEPNVRTFWGKHGKANSPEYAKEYTALVKTVVPVMRAAVPDCTLLAGSVSCLGWVAVDPWMETCFTEGMLESGIDGWSVHPYSLKRPEDYGAAYTSARTLMAKHGKVLPLLNTERGFPLGKELEGFAGGEGDQRDYQAWHFVRQYMNDLMNDVRLTNWYEWTGQGNEAGFSLHDGAKSLPITDACRVMLKELAGYKFDKRFALASPEDYVLAFNGPNGGRKLVAWTAPAPGKKPDEAVVHPVQVPVAVAAPLVTIAIYGAAGTAPVADGAVTLTLAGAPQYVTVLAGR